MLSHIERGDSIGSCSSEGEQTQKPESQGEIKTSHGESSSNQNGSSSQGENSNGSTSGEMGSGMVGN